MSPTSFGQKSSSINKKQSLQCTVNKFQPNSGPFLSSFLPLEQFPMIKPQCLWYQMKACNVPNQFWLQKFFIDNKQSLQSTVNKFQLNSIPFLSSFLPLEHLKLIQSWYLWSQMIACNVLYQFRAHFDASQKQKSEQNRVRLKFLAHLYPFFEQFFALRAA